MGGTCSAYDGVEIYIGIRQEFMKERDHLEDLGIYGRRLLRSGDNFLRTCFIIPFKYVEK